MKREDFDENVPLRQNHILACALRARRLEIFAAIVRRFHGNVARKGGWENNKTYKQSESRGSSFTSSALRAEL